MKKTNLIIRISERDKEQIRQQAEKMQMSMSEYILYLVHREETYNSVNDKKGL